MRKKKILLPFASLALLLGVGLTGCGEKSTNGDDNKGKDEVTAVEKITITAEGNKKSLILGETVKLTASQEGVTWTSSKPEVATIDANGVVTSVDKGSTTIKASKEGFKDGSFNISVDYERIVITPAAGEDNRLLINETLTLTADKAGVTWESSNPTVASVENGVVTAHALGNATITAKKDKLNSGTYNIEVTRPDPTAVLHMEDAYHYAADGWWASSSNGSEYGPGATPIYSKDSASDGTCVAKLTTGDKETLKFKSSANVKAEMVLTMIGTSSYEDLNEIFTAKLNGVDLTFTGGYTGGSDYPVGELSFGEVDLIADNVLELNFLKSAPYLDDVKFYATSATTITVDAAPEMQQTEVVTEKIEIEEGGTAQIEATTPDVIYVSNNEAVATVDEHGLVTGVAKGKTKISVFKEGYKAVRLEVTVAEKALAGEIKVEAEDCITDETSGITSRKVSSGETATDTFDEGAVLTVKFNVENAGTYDLYIALRGNSSSRALDIAAGLGLKFNNQDITYEASITGRSFQTLKIAAVQTIVGENILLVTGLSGTRPNIDFFKLAPVAAPSSSQTVS